MGVGEAQCSLVSRKQPVVDFLNTIKNELKPHCTIPYVFVFSRGCGYMGYKDFFFFSPMTVMVPR